MTSEGKPLERESWGEKVRRADHWLIARFLRHAHLIHRVSLGLMFIWFGLLKPLGHKTTTSLLAHSVYWGDPETIVLLLGWWEVAIGVSLMYRPTVRIAMLLLAVRLPFVILALILKTETCFIEFPFAPTPEGQYLIKDLVIFLAALAIVRTLHEPSRVDARGESG